MNTNLLSVSFEINFDNPFFICSYVATACCIVRKPIFDDFAIITSAKTFRYLDIGPSPMSSNVLSFKPLLLILNFFGL